MAFLDRENDYLDALIFLGVVVLGIATELALRLWLDVSAIIVTFLLVAYLGTYAYVIYKGKYTKLSRIQSADNFYYMGFLFTVVALAVALVKFSWQDQQEHEVLLRLVVGDLGVGLATTVVGLLLRVLFTQFRHSPEEIEDKVSSNLKERARDIERQFNTTMDLFKHMNFRMMDFVHEAEKAVEIVMNEFPNKVEKVHAEVTQSISNSYRKAIAEIDMLAISLNRINSEFDISLLESSVQKAAQNLESVGVPVQNLNQKITELSLSMVALVDEIEKVEITEKTLDLKLKKVVKTAEIKLQNALKKLHNELAMAKEKIIKTVELKQEEIRKIQFSPWRPFKALLNLLRGKKNG